MTEEKTLKRIAIGESDFKKIREAGYYYVDKTEMILEIHKGAKAFVFNIPEHFGKTTILSMIDAFYNMEYKGNDWFDGLKITEYGKYADVMNSRPVINLKMKDVRGPDYQSFVEGLRKVVSDALRPFSDLKDCEKLNEWTRKIFLKTPDSFGLNDPMFSMKRLCAGVVEAYDKKPIVLVDDYDAHLINTVGCEDFDTIVSELIHFYSCFVKDNDDVDFTVLAGLMHWKEFLRPELNNVSRHNMVRNQYCKNFVFTADEVMELCNYYGHPEKYEEAKEWYGGYLIEDTESFNPWSILNYVCNGFKTDDYWADFNKNRLINTALDGYLAKDCLAMKRLATWNCDNFYEPLYISLMDLKSDPYVIGDLLPYLGYFKVIYRSLPNYDYIHEENIPNREIYDAFRTSMMKLVTEDAIIAYGELLEGMEKTDMDMMKNALNMMLTKNIPFVVLSDIDDFSLILATMTFYCRGKYSIEKVYVHAAKRILIKANDSGLPNIALTLKKSDAKTMKGLKASATKLSQVKIESDYCIKIEGRTLAYSVCTNGDEFAISFKEVNL